MPLDRRSRTANLLAFLAAAGLLLMSGAARAQFKIGHRIDNTTTAVQTMAATVDFNLRQEIEASGVPAPATVTTVTPPTAADFTMPRFVWLKAGALSVAALDNKPEATACCPCSTGWL